MKKITVKEVTKEMNLVETWVTNIRSVEKIIHLDFCLYEIICDTNCYGHKKENVKIHVNDYDYQMIRDKGYYLT